MEKIKYAHRYVPREDAEFWTSLPEFEAVPADWEADKWAIFEGYPGSTLANQWTSQDLCQLSATHVSQLITSLKEFSVFHRKISAMGSWLIKDGHVDDLGLQIIYLEAIEPGLHHQILCHLWHFLQQHDHSRPYQVKDIMDTAYTSWIHEPLNSTQELRSLICLPQSIWLLNQRIPLQKLLPVQLLHILQRLLNCIHLRLLTSFLDHMSQPILFVPNLPDSTIQLAHILQRLPHYIPLSLLTSFGLHAPAHSIHDKPSPHDPSASHIHTQP